MPIRDHACFALTVGMLSLNTVTPDAARAQSAAAPTHLNAGTVSTTDAGQGAASPSSTVLTPARKFRSTQAETSVDKSRIKLLGPQAGGLQSLTLAPGVIVAGYANATGASRSTLEVRGVKVGWNSVPGDLETNGLTAELDGIPLNSLIQSTGWHSTEVPLGLLLSGTNLIYGPGDPRERYYDSIGGTVNFIPIQPTDQQHAAFSASYGSFDSQTYSGIFDTGTHQGWSSVIAFAHTSFDTFRQGPSSWPSTGDQVFTKTRKSWASGHVSLGFYWQHSDELRPNQVPVDPIPGVTTAGLNQNAELYSQKNSGFYSDLPRSVWFKENQIENYVAYAKLTQNLGGFATLHDDFWYRHGAVTHYRVNALYPPDNPTGTEFYDPTSDTVGDKLYADMTIYPGNVLTVGGYAITAHTINRLDLYNEQLGTSRAQPSYLQFGTYDNTDLSAFAQDHIKLFDRLDIIPGIALVNYHTSFYDNSLAAAAGAPGASYTLYPHSFKEFNRFEPSVGANLKLLPWLSAYANVALTYQNPTASNYTNLQTNLPALKPVKSNDDEVGLRVLHDGIFGYGQTLADVNYFRDHLSDETIPLTLAANPGLTTFGFGDATLQGANAEFSTDIDPNWQVFANGEYLNAVWNGFYSTTTNSNFNGYPVSNSPVTTANLGVTYSRHFGSTLLTTTVFDQYVGRRYLYSNQLAAPTRRTITPYNLLNLTIDAEIPLAVPNVPLQKLDVSFFISNLLARRYNSTEYISAGSYFGTGAGTVLANPGAPQAFYGTVGVSF